MTIGHVSTKSVGGEISKPTTFRCNCSRAMAHCHYCHRLVNCSLSDGRWKAQSKGMGTSGDSLEQRV